MTYLDLVHSVHLTLALTPLHLLVEVLVLKHIIVSHSISLLLLLLLKLLLPSSLLVGVRHQVIGIGAAEVHHGLVGIIHRSATLVHLDLPQIILLILKASLASASSAATHRILIK